jgi:hypothetical protein
MTCLPVLPDAGTYIYFPVEELLLVFMQQHRWGHASRLLWYVTVFSFSVPCASSLCESAAQADAVAVRACRMHCTLLRDAALADAPLQATVVTSRRR